MAGAKDLESMQLLKSNVIQWSNLSPQHIYLFNSFVAGIERNQEDFNQILMRFLRANSFNQKKALKMICNHIQWRHAFQGIGVDHITEASIRNEILRGTAFFCGQDKEMRPIVYTKTARHFKSQCDPKEVERMTVHLFEFGRRLLRPPIQHVTLFFDMRGFSHDNMDFHGVKFMIDMFASKYPDTVGSILIVDAPAYFHAVFKIISVLLPSNLKEKKNYIGGTKGPQLLHRLLPASYRIRGQVPLQQFIPQTLNNFKLMI